MGESQALPTANQGAVGSLGDVLGACGFSEPLPEAVPLGHTSSAVVGQEAGLSFGPAATGLRFLSHCPTSQCPCLETGQLIPSFFAGTG